MFGTRKQPPIRTLIGEGTVLEGEIRYSEGLRIDGRVVGNVIAIGDEPNLLVIGEKASITGRVKAGHVIVNGEVCGPVDSSELLELQPKARIEGNVRYARLEMHQGAQVHGELRPQAAQDKPAVVKLAPAPGLSALGHNTRVAGDRQTKET
ncbi:MAG: polymer-forming cytoskeletal protein [Methylibium sp.]|uniref:bactofilin family protein n=1 Tax=Methylibium sp. TaxID=2067992 RepID=UPI001837EE47|nr:polymer-forming cytoskeletal protein [Methylibium sp.]MBA2722962.1 polymer-forming cytoskeletal protein [Methylibium sp.]MBA3588475.1 polymer-forming cytoskeletal protein [Methylibium sp.]MBA3623581.1 polymer-forming cytoskeletal protein [Methylibium sp.]